MNFVNQLGESLNIISKTEKDKSVLIIDTLQLKLLSAQQENVALQQKLLQKDIGIVV